MNLTLAHRNHKLRRAQAARAARISPSNGGVGMVAARRAVMRRIRLAPVSLYGGLIVHIEPTGRVQFTKVSA